MGGGAKHSSSGAAIGGGVAGGIALIALVAVLWYCFVRRPSRSGEIDLEEEGPSMAQTIPHPYVPGGATAGSTAVARTSTTHVHRRSASIPGAGVVVPAAAAATTSPNRRSSILKEGSFSSEPNSEFNPYAPTVYSTSAGPSTVARSASPTTTTANEKMAHALTLSGGRPLSEASNRPLSEVLATPDVRQTLPAMSEPDMDRLAARVASMIGAPAAATPAVQTSPVVTQPPHPIPHAAGEDEEAPPQYTR